jgi:hypothetical protein
MDAVGRALARGLVTTAPPSSLRLAVYRRSPRLQLGSPGQSLGLCEQSDDRLPMCLPKAAQLVATGAHHSPTVGTTETVNRSLYPLLAGQSLWQSSRLEVLAVTSFYRQYEHMPVVL